MKRIVSATLALCVMITGLVILQPAASAKTKKAPPARPTITAVDNIDTTTMRIKWSKVKGAKGYVLYSKAPGAKYKKLAATGKKRTFTHKNLITGKKYFYKVRAYKIHSGKKRYGKYSFAAAKKTTNLLLKLVKPYYTENYNVWYDYNEYTEPSVFQMAGDNYSNGFTLCSGGCRAVFNLKSRYRKITFTLGTIDKWDRTLSILSDDECIATISVKGNSLPKNYTVDIENAAKLEFISENENHLTEAGLYIGLANIRVFK